MNVINFVLIAVTVAAEIAIIVLLALATRAYVKRINLDTNTFIFSLFHDLELANKLAEIESEVQDLKDNIDVLNEETFNKTIDEVVGVFSVPDKEEPKEAKNEKESTPKKQTKTKKSK